MATTDRGGNPLETVLCTGCGVVSHRTIPADDELRAFYSRRYRLAYKGAWEPRRRQIVRNFNYVSSFFNQFGDRVRTAEHILDVGSGSGEFLFFCKLLGLDVVGLEPNERYAAFSREQYDVDVRTTTLDDCSFDKNSFDFIRINHVLEHTNRPVEVLAKLRLWLSDDGFLFVAVPDIERYASHKSGNNLFHFGHIFNFNHWTLKACAGLAGFSVVSAGDGTKLLFRKDRCWSPGDAANTENARRVQHALNTPRSAAKVPRRMARKLVVHLREAQKALRFRNPAAIGRHFVSGYRT